MSAELDLGAYLRRIGLDVAPAADLPGLKALHFAHATHIPFENLDIQMAEPRYASNFGELTKLLKMREEAESDLHRVSKEWEEAFERLSELE